MMSINNKRLVGVETDPDNPTDPVTSTNVTIRVLDNARFEIGTPTIIGGGFQVGNAYGKANLLFEPSRATNSITFTLEIDGRQLLANWATRISWIWCRYRWQSDCRF